jgi:hypothetical protein
VRLAGGAGLAAAKGSMGAWKLGRLGCEGGGKRKAGARARERVWARNGLAEGGFLFSFSISISFISFSFEQIIS